MANGSFRVPAMTHLVLAGVLAGWSAPGSSAPIYQSAADVPEVLRHDFIFAATSLVLALPTVPSGRGSAIASTTVEKAASNYEATAAYILGGADAGEVAGRSINPEPQRLAVPRLSGDGRSFVLPGQGAVGVDETVPRTVRVTDPDGTSHRAQAVATLSGATGASGAATDATHALLAGGIGTWTTIRDADDTEAGNQSGLIQTQLQYVARTENGPALDVVSASAVENVFTRLPRGPLSVSPEISLHLTTTMGLPELPKPGRESRVIFQFAGFVSFLADPVWSWIIEYQPDGTVLQRFTASDLLRRADDASRPLDVSATEETLKQLLHLGEDGRPGTAGALEVNDTSIFDAQIIAPRRFDYTQRTALYVSLFVPEPGTVPLLMVLPGAWVLARRLANGRRRRRPATA
ncbi:MAG: hypothetical protein GC151_18535 [Betaproteobacteria bacterium]|nr:hypothetical protein [Betaproteobacteria bacterium]